MKEIGGYIELEYNKGTLFHDTAVPLNCGRRALSYLIKSRNIDKIWLPKFMCSSVEEPCRKAGISIEYYSIGEDLRPIDLIAPSNDWVYLINYYGQINKEEIKQIYSSHKNLIVDNAQAFFQLPVKGIDTIYNCRKYFGVSDGAFLYTDAQLDEELSRDESYAHMQFLLGRMERTASEFYNEYNKNNHRFDEEPMKRMSILTENLLRGIDYDFVAERRSANFIFLHQQFARINKLNISVPVGPYMYPLYIEDGERIRKELQKRKIYIPTLWPDVFNHCASDTVEYNMAENILPLPIDQRYGQEEMQIIIDSLREVSQWI